MSRAERRRNCTRILRRARCCHRLGGKPIAPSAIGVVGELDRKPTLETCAQLGFVVAERVERLREQRHPLPVDSEDGYPGPGET
jgi:hypothetical protein